MTVSADGQVQATTILGPEGAGDGEKYFHYAMGVGVNAKGTLVYGATEGHDERFGEHRDPADPAGGELAGLGIENGLWQVYLDSDNDDVCDYEDNCLGVANGPGNGSNQVDTDGDGFGNACDADYTQDDVVGGPDQLILYRAFNTSNEPVTDHDGNGITGGSDILFFAPQWGGPPKGRSGYDCADRAICIAGNPHCESGPDPA